MNYPSIKSTILASCLINLAVVVGICYLSYVSVASTVQKVSNITQARTFVLSDRVDHPFAYTSLLNALDFASEGDHIYIVLENNDGGLLYTTERIKESIINTRATIHTSMIGRASSAALNILFMGDFITVPKTIVGIAHLSNNAKGYDSWIIPKVAYLRSFMTPQEWQAFVNDADITLYGKRVCSIAKTKISETVSTCVLKGVLR